MLTLGYITKLNDAGDNLFEVRVPIFEKAGSSKDSPALCGSYFQATLNQAPGQSNALLVGDCVVIGFLDDRTERPIILGKLFLNGSESDSRGFLNSNALTVKDKATLPPNTKIGDIQYSELLEMVRASEFLQEWSKYLNTGYIEANPTTGTTVGTLSSIRIGNAKFNVPTPLPPSQLQYYQHSIQLMLQDESYMELSLISREERPFGEDYIAKTGYENIIAVKGDPEMDMQVVHARRFRMEDDSVFIDYYISGASNRLFSVKVVKLVKDEVCPI